MVDLSDGGNGYFADGLTEQMISIISRIEGVRVVPRTSVMTYRGVDKRIAEIGGELGYMDGNTAETKYLMTRAYFYWDRPFNFINSGFLSGDAIYVRYEEPVFGKDRSIFFALGGGMDLYKDYLKLKLSGDYSDDPFFDSDIRGMLVILFIY